jgi:hypothetical protein
MASINFKNLLLVCPDWKPPKAEAKARSDNTIRFSASDEPGLFSIPKAESHNDIANILLLNQLRLKHFSNQTHYPTHKHYELVFVKQPIKRVFRFHLIITILSNDA